MKLVWFERDKGFVSYASKYLVVLLADFGVTRALSTLSKCAFMLPTIEYLGHRIPSEGIQPTTGKVRAVLEAPAPQNITQLRSFLGMINYYAKFLAQLSTLLEPLYGLLQKKTRWIWGVAQKRALEEAKKGLTS